ncbi:hypothetical protein [Lentzea sp. CA-135723]|uniref:hypothetical protein n=1 Tax=Lentzea sp. CA-135723 TaxID=3239950 RepID=UPI003D8D16E5
MQRCAPGASRSSTASVRPSGSPCSTSTSAASACATTTCATVRRSLVMDASLSASSSQVAASSTVITHSTSMPRLRRTASGSSNGSRCSTTVWPANDDNNEHRSSRTVQDTQPCSSSTSVAMPSTHRRTHVSAATCRTSTEPGRSRHTRTATSWSTSPATMTTTVSM